MVVLDFATDAWFKFIGLTQEHRRRHNITTFSLEAHITYQREVSEGDPLRFTTRLLAFDAKRIHYFDEMYHAGQGYLAATNELMSLHVSRETRRAAPMTPEILQRLAQIKQAHERLPVPAQVGRIIGLKSKPAGKK
jgi:acyl-CoA thioester hydrolase